MAQIKFPPEFALQISLLNNIIAKNNEPGFDSPLTPWLSEKEIDLGSDKTTAGDAEALEELHNTLDAASKMAYTSRDNNFKPVFKLIRTAAQVLKKFYSSNYAKLRDWGIPITDSGRIDYPPSFDERNTLATSFFTKLVSFPAGQSPLEAYFKVNKTDIKKISAKNSDAAKNNTTAITAAKAAENATEQRNNLWKDPLQHIHDIGDYLKSIYPDNPRALGEWGFVVDESVTTAKAKKVKFIIGQTKVLNNVAIGSIVTNLGKGDAIVYKGKDINGEMTVLKANEKIGIIKGYSIITVVNPSTLETLELSILPPEK